MDGLLGFADWIRRSFGLWFASVFLVAASSVLPRTQADEAAVTAFSQFRPRQEIPGVGLICSEVCAACHTGNGTLTDRHGICYEHRCGKPSAPISPANDFSGGIVFVRDRQRRS